MSFSFPQKVLFKHCDPAGLVFYPRYFEMINDCIEAFFDEIGSPFEVIHPGAAVPTVRIEADFTAPSRHGDMLDFALGVVRVGRTSAHLSLEARSGQETRLKARSVLVYVDASGKPQAWPEDLRQTLSDHTGHIAP